MIMEHINVEALGDGYFRLTPDNGYKLYNDNTQTTYSEAVVKSTAGFRAVYGSDAG